MPRARLIGSGLSPYSDRPPPRRVNGALLGDRLRQGAAGTSDFSGPLPGRPTAATGVTTLRFASGQAGAHRPSATRLRDDRWNAPERPHPRWQTTGRPRPALSTRTEVGPVVEERMSGRGARREERQPNAEGTTTMRRDMAHGRSSRPRPENEGAGSSPSYTSTRHHPDFMARRDLSTTRRRGPNPFSGPAGADGHHRSTPVRRGFGVPTSAIPPTSSPGLGATRRPAERRKGENRRPHVALDVTSGAAGGPC